MDLNIVNANLYLRPRPPKAWAFWIANAFLLALLGWLGMRCYAQYVHLQHQKEVRERMTMRATARPQPKPSRTEQESSRLWAELQVERDFPWQQVFRMVEQTDSADIELLGLVPDKRHRIVLLRGQALNAEALLAYLDKLGSQPLMSQVYLMHEQIVSKDRLDTIAFEIKISLH